MTNKELLTEFNNRFNMYVMGDNKVYIIVRPIEFGHEVTDVDMGFSIYQVYPQPKKVPEQV